MRAPTIRQCRAKVLKALTTQRKHADKRMGQVKGMSIRFYYAGKADAFNKAIKIVEGGRA